MKTITYYRVEISDSSGVIKDRNVFTVAEVPILAENERRMVLNDEHFTVLSKDAKSYSNECVGKKSIGLYTGDSVWGNRVTFTLYTFNKVRASTIRKEIEAAIQKKFGFFVTGLNLDIITDKRAAA